MSGYGYQERRTKKHAREGEQQKKSDEIYSQFIMKLERRFENATPSTLTLWLALALSLSELWEKGQHDPCDAKHDENHTQKVYKVLRPSSK